MTDIATGWTENRSVRNKAQTWVVAALEDTGKVPPFPLLRVDSDNGSEFINYHLLAWCEQRKITFFPPGVQQPRCARGAEELGRGADRGRLPPLRHPPELLLLNKIWVLQSKIPNFFLAQQN